MKAANSTLKMDNDLYIKDGTPINDIYARVVENIFGATLESVDFRNKMEEVVRMINDKISRNTNGLIKNFIKASAVDLNTDLMSVNSFYYKGAWKEPFEEETEKKTFYAVSGPVEVDMLKSADRSVFVKDVPSLNLKIFVKILLDTNFKLVIVTTRDAKTPLSKVEETIRSKQYNFLGQLDNGYKVSSTFYMPYVSEEFAVDLLDILEDKLSCWIDKGIDNIVQGVHLPVAKIRHKVKLEIAAKGIEGAAVTGSELGIRMAPNKNEIVVNRPFLYFIIHADGPILFKGRYVGPS
ncbi:unnamed protein product [Gordionus sp. m RMFG-2023]|uniref:serpin B10-like n=1 Tax=Gordionus sp. m RMFG-2023 TaxID=3053472 RepID=UPI0030E16ADD